MVDSASVRSNNSGDSLLVQSLKDMPQAAGQLASEAWQHPLSTAGHVAKTLAESAGAGVLLGELLPSRGMAAVATSAVFLAPMVLGEYRKYQQAYDELKHGGNKDELARNLASSNVSDLGNLGLSFVGGGIGTGAGHWLAKTDSPFGAIGQASQRMVLNAENKALLTAGSFSMKSLLGGWRDQIGTPRPSEIRSFASRASGATADAAEATADAAEATPSVTPAQPVKPWFVRKGSALHTRLQQLQATPDAWVEKDMSFHGHYNADDGMGTAAQNFASAQKSGMDGYAITPHNHALARDGVDDQVRIDAEKDVPLIATQPSEYQQLVADAKAATQEGTFVAMYGNELGTIGKPLPNGSIGIEPPHGPNTPAPHGPLEPSSGVNLPMDMLAQANPSAKAEQLGIRANPDPEAGPLTVRRSVLEPDGTLHVHRHVLPPEAADLVRQNPEFADTSVHVHSDGLMHNFDHPDEHSVGNGDGSVPVNSQGAVDWAQTHHGGGNHIGSIGNDFMIVADVTGKPGPVQNIRNFGRRLVGLQPKDGSFTAADGTVHYNDGDLNTLLNQLQGKDVWLVFNHPRDNIKGDYGLPSFQNRAAWAKAMGTRVRGIEVIKGEALNPNPLSVMRPQDLVPAYMSVYNAFGAVKDAGQGLHLSPFYGRDDHYAIPGARPAATGVFIKNTDTFNQASVMDAIANRRTTATTNYRTLRGYMTANNETFMMGSILDQGAVKQLDMTMHLTGQIDPNAQYTLNLWGDPNLLDNKLASIVQTKTVSGKDILSNQGKVQFDSVTPKLGNKGNWYVEVQRTDPSSGNVDYLWTAPIWVEPLAGSTHALWTRAAVGAGAQYLLK